MNKFLLTIGAMSLLASSAHSETVLLSEDFDNDYSENFPTVLDLDALEPASDIRTLFSGSAGYYMPWWHLKEASTYSNRFIGSHSRYTKGGTSNDWLGSRAITIPSKGFILSFDAQSYTIAGTDDRISDLWVFITEEPVTRNNVPSIPTAVFENVPTGASQEVIEGDFKAYEISLDEYAGKTIYINFANLNTNRDLLLIDNVKVVRYDKAELTLGEGQRYITDDSYAVDYSIRAIEDIDGYTMRITDENGTDAMEYGAIKAGETIAMTITRPIAADQTLNYNVALVLNDGAEVSRTGIVSRLTYSPWRKVLVEESTGMWCGYCPGGTYTIESMHADPEMSKYVVPVSVHVSSDNMAMPAYGSDLGVPYSAPIFFVNRTNIGGPSAKLDYTFDKYRVGSIARTVADCHATPTRVGISASASWVISGNDTTAIKCEATVIPALSDDANALRVGFILVENNVGLDNNQYFMQTNSLSGKTGSQYLQYWSDLDSYVLNLRYNDVARKITDFSGAKGSLPSALKADESYTYATEFDVPDTRIVDQNGILAAPAICRANCVLIAFVIDPETGEILNAAEYPMSEQATERFTTEKYFASLSGVEDVIVDTKGESTYYDLHGRRIAKPGNGIYICRRGSSVELIHSSY